MSNRTVEVIDSSRMRILSDFRYVDEPVNNIEHYYLGVSGDKFVTKIKDLAGNFVGKVFFDLENYAQVVEKIEDVYAGKLRDSNAEYFNIEKGGDDLIIGITQTFPHTSFQPIVRFKISNNRRAVIDGDETGGRDLYLSQATGKLMLAEMKRIENQIVNPNER